MEHEPVFRPAVKAELDEIVTYYEQQRKGLGILFLEVFDLSAKRIQENPLLFQVRHKQIRKSSVKNFPYNIYFRVQKNQIVFLAVLHQKRNPKLWKTRR